MIESRDRNIARWETGRHVPRGYMLRRLAAALDVTIDDLFTAPAEDEDPVAA